MNAFHTFVDPLVSRVLSALGGPDSWQTYLLSRFFAEVVLVVVLVLGAYHLLTVVATRGSQFLEEPLPSAPRSRQPKAPAAAAPPSAVATAAPALASTGGLGLPAGSVVGATTGSGSGGSSKGSLMRLVPAALTGAPARLLVLLVLAGSLMRLVHAALTGAPARLFVLLVLAVNVTRNSAFIIDGFIATFNPRLPVAWLDDLVRLVGKSLTPLDSFLTKLSLAGTTLFACAVLLKWKDASVAWFVKQHVETLDQGQEIITGFLNPASNLVNLLVIVGTALWLAMHLGLNLQPLLAVGGASGIIIGLGTQQILSNFVSGLNIFLARPFVAGEYISILGPNLLATQVSGKVIRVDPMRTLLATQDHWCIAVPNKMIADCVVINRTRTPHWSVGSASPLLSNMRELRFRLKLPHESLSRLKELSTALDAALEEAMPRKTVRRSEVVMELVEFTEKGAEVIVKCNLAWRLRKDPSEMPSREQHAQQEAKETLMQAALLALHGVVRRYDGLLVSGYF